jgi:hypothetical protein
VSIASKARAFKERENWGTLISGAYRKLAFVVSQLPHSYKTCQLNRSMQHPITS